MKQTNQQSGEQRKHVSLPPHLVPWQEGQLGSEPSIPVSPSQPSAHTHFVYFLQKLAYSTCVFPASEKTQTIPQ